jgi:hypothetical protein
MGTCGNLDIDVVSRAQEQLDSPVVGVLSAKIMEEDRLPHFY